MLDRADLNVAQPFIDGSPVGAGYGVLIECERKYPLGPVDGVFGHVLVAWLTKRNAAGEYEKVEPLSPRVRVHGWDDQGRALDFCAGLLTLKESTYVGSE